MHVLWYLLNWVIFLSYNVHYTWCFSVEKKSYYHCLKEGSENNDISFKLDCEGTSESVLHVLNVQYIAIPDLQGKSCTGQVECDIILKENADKVVSVPQDVDKWEELISEECNNSPRCKYKLENFKMENIFQKKNWSCLQPEYEHWSEYVNINYICLLRTDNEGGYVSTTSITENPTTSMEDQTTDCVTYGYEPQTQEDIQITQIALAAAIPLSFFVGVLAMFMCMKCCCQQRNKSAESVKKEGVQPAQHDGMDRSMEVGVSIHMTSRNPYEEIEEAGMNRPITEKFKSNQTKPSHNALVRQTYESMRVNSTCCSHVPGDLNYTNNGQEGCNKNNGQQVCIPADDVMSTIQTEAEESGLYLVLEGEKPKDKCEMVENIHYESQATRPPEAGEVVAGAPRKGEAKETV